MAESTYAGPSGTDSLVWNIFERVMRSMHTSFINRRLLKLTKFHRGTKIFWKLKTSGWRDKEMAPWVKCLWYTHEDLSSDLQHRCKGWAQYYAYHNPTTSERVSRDGQTSEAHCLASWYRGNSEPQVCSETLYWKIRWRATEEDLWQ